MLYVPNIDYLFGTSTIHSLRGWIGNPVVQFNPVIVGIVSHYNLNVCSTDKKQPT